MREFGLNELIGEVRGLAKTAATIDALRNGCFPTQK
jgi:hypothetical protein